MEVLFLKNEQINYTKWNQAISESIFPLTYAYTWYLNSACENWGALVTADYSIVMPLPYKTKFNQLIIYMPSMIPKLGFFSKKMPNKTQIEQFFNTLPKNILTFNISLNKFNTFNKEENITKKTYNSIDLYYSYTKNYDNYSTFLKTTLNSLKKNYIISGLSTNEIIAFLNKTNYFSDSGNYNAIRKIISITATKNTSKVMAIFSETNELIGIGIFILSSYTADLLLIATINDDMKTSALIIDKFIKINSGKVLTFNYECKYSSSGQKIFAEFGSSTYYRLKVNFKRFPKIYKLLNRKNK